MELKFLIKENNPSLFLFLAGWGMDEHPFIPLLDRFRSEFPRHDLCIIFNYTDLSTDLSSLEKYKEIVLRAWSMGVWAASRIFNDHELPIRSAVAINGTPLPVDDRYGIPRHIFRGTLETLSARNLERFNRRMCGTGEPLAYFQSHAPQRTLDSLRDELEAIERQAVEDSSGFSWDEALIGSKDLIFPPAAQEAAWAHIPVRRLDIQHFSPMIPLL